MSLMDAPILTKEFISRFSAATVFIIPDNCEVYKYNREQLLSDFDVFAGSRIIAMDCVDCNMLLLALD